MHELVLGAGNSDHKQVYYDGVDASYQDPVRVDIDPDCKPDLEWDLNELPLPFDDQEFDEIHAYSILEHLGAQGDWRGWFREWTEWYRLLKPAGTLHGVCPKHGSPWQWGDPGHTRVVTLESMMFLDQGRYEAEVGVTTMTDYRHVWKGDFKVIHHHEGESDQFFVLRRD